ncbi:MAG TPA: UPF0149 family protein [Gammaproteobacteria bacterium]|nr:UPF0149 family protein [Gammaproteobacteria bacterium]
MHMNKPPAFAAAQAAQLEQFLNAPERPQGTLRYCELAGFLFAVACSPEMVQMSEWIPVIFNDKEASFETLEEAQEILPLIMGLYNHANNGVLDGKPELPPLCTVRSPAIANLEPDAPLSQWARGFMEGYDWLKNIWDAYSVPDLDEVLGTNLMVLTFFTSRNLAEAYRKESREKKEVSLERMAEIVLRNLPDAMREFAYIGRSLYQAGLEKASAEKPEPARSVKIGRNELCPCGSGRKYKHCCGATRH